MGERMNSNLLIGWGEADITPAHNRVELAGQYYQRIATGIHSRIKAVALLIEKNDQQAMMISIDVANFPEELQISVRKKINQAIPRIATHNIFLNAIHTHNAPYTRPSGLFRDWLPLDPDAMTPAVYIEFLERQIVAAASEAWNSRKPGGIAAAFGSARIGHCRRAVYADGTAEMYGDTSRPDFIGMEAGEDSGVDMLFTFDKQGKSNGMIINVPCPAQVMEASYMISSDYLGAARELLKQDFGDNFHCLCQISAAGCQSPRDLSRNYRTEADFWHADGVTELAERVREAVINAFPDTKDRIDYDPAFIHRCQRVSLPIRRASYKAYTEARQELARLIEIMPEKTAFEDFCRQTHEIGRASCRERV